VPESGQTVAKQVCLTMDTVNRRFRWLAKVSDPEGAKQTKSGTLWLAQPAGNYFRFLKKKRNYWLT
jgi:hypothetical protein